MMVTVYADTIGLLSEEECDKDNLCEVEVPDRVVEEWYQENKLACDAEAIANGFDPTFYDWYYHAYTADSTNGLIAFAADRYSYIPQWVSDGHGFAYIELR